MSQTTSLITGVDFMPLPTHDLPRAVEFYKDKLGLAMSVHVPERGYAEFETGNLTLSLMNAEAMGLEHRVQGHEVALHVEDVAAARAQLESQGIEFRGETFDTGVCHMAFFNDPDGNALMLHHRYAPHAPAA
jgi:predicted enzyme related to lactoylglutathione lyase